MYLCVYILKYVCMHACMYVCMHACMYAFWNTCTYVTFVCVKHMFRAIHYFVYLHSIPLFNRGYVLVCVYVSMFVSKIVVT